MAVVVDPKDVDEFMKYASEENLEATKVAVVTEDPRLVLSWRGKEIVNISGKDEKTLAIRLEKHRQEVHDRIAKEHPELAERFKERRHLLDEHLKEHRPEVYELVLELREKRKE